MMMLLPNMFPSSRIYGDQFLFFFSILGSTISSFCCLWHVWFVKKLKPWKSLHEGTCTRYSPTSIAACSFQPLWLDSPKLNLWNCESTSAGGFTSLSHPWHCLKIWTCAAPTSTTKAFESLIGFQHWRGWNIANMWHQAVARLSFPKVTSWT